MKKLKKFYKNNRIYCILMLISIFCFLLMGTAVVVYFINQTSSSKDGSRLVDQEKYKVDKELKELEKYYKSSEDVNKVSIRLQGKIIYITVDVKSDVDNEDIQNLATTSLEKLTDEQKKYYDIQFIFTREGFTPYLGSKSSQNTIITWAKYSFDTETTTKKAK